MAIIIACVTSSVFKIGFFWNNHRTFEWSKLKKKKKKNERCPALIISQQIVNDYNKVRLAQVQRLFLFAPQFFPSLFFVARIAYNNTPNKLISSSLQIICVIMLSLDGDFSFLRYSASDKNSDWRIAGKYAA